MRPSLPTVRLIALLALLLVSALPEVALAQNAPAEATTQQDPGSVFNLLPTFGSGDEQADYELPIQLLLLLTVLSLAPAIIILMTSFTRLVVIFSILRTAMGTQQSPPNQVITGLAMFLTFYIMAPVIQTVNEDALQPYITGQITQQEALANASQPVKAFLLQQTREKDLMLFMDMAQIEVFDQATDVPLHVLVPAFVISELRIAFQIGFMIFLPFLIVDLIVASVLMSMGMMMLPPVMVSLPLKLLLFVLSDGWYLIAESVVRGYMGS